MQPISAPESASLLHDDALAAFAALSTALAAVPQNGQAWTYTINGRDGSPYITRTLLPRIGAERVLLHQIHRPDADPYLHNHPWATARFLVLTGGYVEHRLVGDEVITRTLVSGDINSLDADTFHRVDSVLPNTWTLGLVGPRVQAWGFLVDGKIELSADYFARVGYTANAPGLS